MGWSSFIKVVGIVGIYYIIKNGEMELIHSTNSDPWANDGAYTLAQNWINAGAPLEETSVIFKGIKDTVAKFNDFLDDLWANESDYKILDEWKSVDPNTGRLVLDDWYITLPNGLTLKIVDGGQLQNFRINYNSIVWYGFFLPAFGVLGNYYCLAYRLKETPNFSWIIPESDELLFVDPLDGQVKPGKDCTPPKAIEDNDVEYITTCLLIVGFIANVLQSLGMYKTLSAWWTKMMTNKKFRAVRADIESVESDVDLVRRKLREFNDQYSLFATDWNSSSPSIIKKFPKPWSPYGGH